MRCDGCGRRFLVEEEPGALLLEHPRADGTCAKHHLCQNCEKATLMFVAKLDRTTPGVEDASPPFRNVGPYSD